MREKKTGIMQEHAVTLIALVVTIVILMILAAVSINVVIGENGIITKAQEVKEIQAQAEENTQIGFNQLASELENSITTAKKENIANSPDRIDGLTPIKFTDPTESTMGSYKTTTWDDTSWYNYDEQKWANAISADGSMWVWIPRYAYQITYTDAGNASKGGTIQVKFLQGTSDSYYDEEHKLQTAKRCMTEEEEIDTTIGYTVHPAFANESNVNFRNGGWDSELRGIWVAKFEAGYAQGNNSTPVVASNVNYSQTTSWVTALEAGTEGASGETARNWLDGIYGTTPTAIKYPVFQPVTYSMNYININDANNISKHLTDSGNSYGFNSSNADSHLMKNSEWGAIAYLSQSQYGLNGVEIAVNNINLNSGGSKRTNAAGKSGVDSVYAVTGCTTGRNDSAEVITTIQNINGLIGNTANVDGIYVWNQLTGTKASTTGNITGIYDMSGGNWERNAGYVNNENSNLTNYGSSLLSSTGKNTKYVTIYPHDTTKDNTSIASNDDNLNAASTANYLKNTKIYGDAIRETSTDGSNNTSWNKDSSHFFSLSYPFSLHGGSFGSNMSAGSFSFHRANGYSSYDTSFRPILVTK